MIITPYRKVAKDAFINWFQLTEEEAQKKIETETIQELEGQVYAMDSVKAAVLGLALQAKLNPDRAINLLNCIVNGPNDNEIFDVTSLMAQGLNEKKILNILAVIHNEWVTNNCSDKTFDKKVNKEQLRQYAPLELIGWNEVLNDLIFLKPILESIRINVDLEKLEMEYHNRVSTYLGMNLIHSKEDLVSLVKQGSAYYPTLPEQLSEKLKPFTETVVEQIINNWKAKDQVSSQIFEAKQQVKESNKLSM